MPFERKEWHNRLSEYPARRRLVSGDEEWLVDVQREEGEVHTAGDAFSAENMNALEGRIEQAVRGLGEDVESLGREGGEALAQHERDGGNPHGVTARQVGALAEDGVARDSAMLGGYLPGWWMPSGAVLPFAGRSVPAGWLVCDGSRVKRAQYPLLYAAVGGAFGGEDDGDSFALPDLRDRFLLGGAFAQRGETGGESEHVLTAGEMPEHGHDLKSFGMNTPAGGLEGWQVHASGQMVARGIVMEAGGGEAHNNMPPFVRMAWIIKT